MDMILNTYIIEHVIECDHTHDFFISLWHVNNISVNQCHNAITLQKPGLKTYKRPIRRRLKKDKMTVS